MRPEILTPTPTVPAAPGAAQRRGSAYAHLSRRVREAGLLARCRRYYAWKIAVTLTMWAGGWVAFVVTGDTWWTLAYAVLFALLFTQLGFLGHDAGHQQITGRRATNDAIGLLLGNLAIGLSFSWWVDKHNRHHSHPNDEDHDPDVAVGAFVFNAHQAAAARGAARWLYRYQAYTFFPLLLLEGINLRVSSIRYLFTGKGQRRGAAEAVLLGLHVAAYLAAVFLVLSPGKAVAFFAVHQGLFGLYLGCSFAPNHKGMPSLRDVDRDDFLRRQVLTSRNVRGGWLTDLALGGLNYQIEHHLFPSMPRPNLRRAQPIVAGYCAEHGIPYLETDLVGSYAQALRHLNTVGRATRAAVEKP